jgi:hypothetical protein
VQGEGFFLFNGEKAQMVHMETQSWWRENCELFLPERVGNWPEILVKISKNAL